MAMVLTLLLPIFAIDRTCWQSVFCLQEAANEQSGEDERRARLSRNSLPTTGPNSLVKTATGKVLWGQSVENREGLRIGGVKIEFENDLASTMLSLLGLAAEDGVRRAGLASAQPRQPDASRRRTAHHPKPTQPPGIKRQIAGASAARLPGRQAELLCPDPVPECGG